MNQFRQSQTGARQYAFMGVIFGLLFPVIATLIRIADADLPYEFSSAVAVQTSDALLWIIDTAPLFLGLFAFFVGQRQDNLQRVNYELKQREGELEDIRANLERTVEEHTRELVLANQQITKRAEQLRLIAAVARSAISEQDVDRLLPYMVQLISQRFGFYHVGIFLLDEQKQFAILSASSSQAGITLIEKGHRVQVGTQGIIGYVSQIGQARIALNAGDDPGYSGSVDLSLIRSEIALPLKSGDIIIGVLDIQSTDPNAFSEEESSTLSILADQMGIAIQNAISFQQSQKALHEVELASRQAAGQMWMGYRKALERRGYRYNGVRSEPLQEASATSISNNTLDLSVRLRGQTIGRLKLNHADPAHTWTEDELAMAEATAERVALALEGARLLEDAQKRAARETFLSEITAKLGTSIQVDSILRDTVEELGQTLRHSTVTFQLVNPSESLSGPGQRQNGSSAREGKTE